MKKLLALALALVFALSLALPFTAEARGGSRSGGGRSYSSISTRSSGGAVAVKGYYSKVGTYVQPHMRSAPNGSKADNWSTKGNVNPYTGLEGTKNPD